MKKNFRKILIGIVIVIVLAVIFMRGDQLEDMLKAMRDGSPLFLVLAVISQLGKYFTQGGQFIWCFKSVGAHIPYSESIKLVFGTFFCKHYRPFP